MATEWLTYECTGRTPATCRAGKTVMLGLGFVPRPATQNEIEAAIQKETEEINAYAAKREKEHAARQNFAERQDYQDAAAISSVLDDMDVDKHPLDRLTPSEWAELRRRLSR